MEVQYYIYEIFNDVTQKRYIGETVNYKKRFLQHRNYLKNGTHTAEGMMKDCIKYGIEHFNFRLIDTASSREKSHQKEKYYMNLYQTWNPEFGYNGRDPRFRRVPSIQRQIKLEDNFFTRLMRKRGLCLHSLANYVDIEVDLLFDKMNNPKLFNIEEANSVLRVLNFHDSFDYSIISN